MAIRMTSETAEEATFTVSKSDLLTCSELEEMLHIKDKATVLRFALSAVRKSIEAHGEIIVGLENGQFRHAVPPPEWIAPPNHAQH